MTFDDLYFDARIFDQSSRKDMYKNDLSWIKRNSFFFQSRSVGLKLSILDFGCADGSFSKLLMDLKCVEIYGIEINELQASMAKQKGIQVFRSLEEFLKLEIIPHIILLRGTAHYISMCELKEIFGINATEVILLQSVNFESKFITRIGARRFQFIYPRVDFVNNVKENSLGMIRLIANRLKYSMQVLDYPYKGTPYFRPMRDLIVGVFWYIFLKAIPDKIKYRRSFPRNVFRVIFRRIEQD